MLKNILTNAAQFGSDHVFVAFLIGLTIAICIFNIGCYVRSKRRYEYLDEDMHNQGLAKFSLIVMLLTILITCYNLTTPIPAGNVVALNLLGFLLAFVNAVFGFGSFAAQVG